LLSKRTTALISLCWNGQPVKPLQYCCLLISKLVHDLDLFGLARFLLAWSVSVNWFLGLGPEMLVWAQPVPFGSSSSMFSFADCNVAYIYNSGK